MSNQVLYVRVASKQEQFFHRAGMRFTKEWRRVEVDDATAGVLYAEQMLEVTEQEPPELVSTVRPELVEGQDGSTSSPRDDTGLSPTAENLPPANEEPLPAADSIVGTELFEKETKPKGKK